MSLNIILAEILKKLKINKYAYKSKIIKKIIKSIIVDKKNDLQKCQEILCNYSKKPNGNSLTLNKIEKIKYDLKIIIPAYNSELYIEECLQSILKQKTKYTVKIIVINDGSKDNTLKIIKKYEKNEKVEIIDQVNKGCSYSRNKALKTIDSKYIMFVDADDKIEENAIENLLNCAFQNNSDIVEGGYIHFFRNKKISIHKHYDKINCEAFNIIRSFPWGKVIKSSYFKNIKFPEGFWYEDTIFMYLIFPNCHNVSTIKDIVYFYRYNPKGVTISSRRKNKSIDTYWITELMIEDMMALKIPKTQEIYEFTITQIYNNFKRTRFMNNEIKKSIFILSANLLDTNFKEFRTSNKYQMDLEKALRERDYKKYYLFCILN